MPVTLDAINKVTAEFMKPYIEAEIRYWDAVASVKAGLSCVKCRGKFVHLGSMGIHCYCDDGWQIRDLFIYAKH